MRIEQSNIYETQIYWLTSYVDVFAHQTTSNPMTQEAERSIELQVTRPRPNADVTSQNSKPGLVFRDHECSERDQLVSSRICGIKQNFVCGDIYITFDASWVSTNEICERVFIKTHYP